MVEAWDGRFSSHFVFIPPSTITPGQPARVACRCSAPGAFQLDEVSASPSISQLCGATGPDGVFLQTSSHPGLTAGCRLVAAFLDARGPARVGCQLNSLIISRSSSR